MFTWYLCRETLKPFILITAILSALFIADELSDTFAKVVTGQYSDWAIAVVLGYQLPILVPELLPAAYFLATLISLNRMSQESERTVFQAIGINDASILRRLLLYTALPAMLVMLAFNHHITPNSEQRLGNFVAEQQNRPLTELVQPGEFFSLAERNATLFATGADNASQTLLNIFMARSDDGRITINNADTASVETLTERQYLTLRQGSQQTFALTPSETTTIDYDSYALYIPQSETQYQPHRAEAKPTIDLWDSTLQREQSEIVFRTLQALLIPVLCIWAVALTRVKPRQARVGAMASGIVLYVLFNFAFRAAQAAVAKGQLPLIASAWWLHLALALVGLYLMWKPLR